MAKLQLYSSQAWMKDEPSLLKCSPLQFHSYKCLLKLMYLVSFPTLALCSLRVQPHLTPVLPEGFFSGQTGPYHHWWPESSHSSQRDLETWLNASHSSPEWLPLYPAPSKINHFILYKWIWNTWSLTTFSLPFSWVTRLTLSGSEFWFMT